MWSDERKEVKLTGSQVADLQEGADYVVTGVLKSHPKYGESLEVSSARPHVKLNERAIVKFLVANYKGVGPKSAQKYVEALIGEKGAAGLEEFRRQLLEAPWDIDLGKINKNGAYSSEEREKTNIAFIQRDLATRLGGAEGVRGPVVNALAKRVAAMLPAVKKGEPAVDPVGAAWAILIKDPYEAIPFVPGYGFSMADAIGRQVNIPRDAPQRLAALVAHAVHEGCESTGHVFLSHLQLRQSIGKVDPLVAVAAALEVASERKTVAIDATDPRGHRVYPYRLLAAEVSMAERVARLCRPGQPIFTGDVASLAAKVQLAAKSLGGAFKNGMDQSQVTALTNILTSRVRLHTITAEPGAGKTAVMEVLTKVLPGKRFVFCAPTGQGAKVLSNRVRSLGCSASTIHSLLQGSGAGDFKVDESNPLEGDVLVVDEGSMPDLAIADAVLRAVNEDMHVVVLGDPDQLPSIAPGRVLQDLLSIPEIDHNTLTTVHRNSGGILDVIREVKRGELSPKNREGVTFSGTLDDAEFGFSEVMGKYIAAVSRAGYEGTALLMSRRKGEADVAGWNTTFANAVLRDVCNPNAQKVPGTSVHVGDRIIIKENMTIPGADGEGEQRVVNGDKGVVRSFSMNQKDARNAGADKIRLALDDGRTIDFPGVASGALQHSYALTVHAGQGSEYAEVIAVITPGAASFINRNMLYTALSRARTNLDVYGEDRVLRQVARTPMPSRNSGLVDRVRDILGNDEDDGEEFGVEPDSAQHRVSAYGHLRREMRR